MASVTLNTVGDVIEIAAANLNDTQQAIWTDARIMPHIKSAVNWLATHIANINSAYFTKWLGAPYTPTDLQYVAATGTQPPVCDITSILPADLYEPVSLEFRLDSCSQWTPMARATKLDAPSPAIPQLLTRWEWSGRTLRVQPAACNAYLRLKYIGLMPDVSDTGDPIPIDNCVQALAFATAAFAYASRGQATQAAAMWGSEEATAKAPPSGAMMYLGLVLGIIVKNEQTVPRRGVPYGGGVDGFGYGWPRP